jgi:hypothetical protein
MAAKSQLQRHLAKHVCRRATATDIGPMALWQRPTFQLQNLHWSCLAGACCRPVKLSLGKLLGSYLLLIHIDRPGFSGVTTSDGSEKPRSSPKITPPIRYKYTAKARLLRGVFQYKSCPDVICQTNAGDDKMLCQSMLRLSFLSLVCVAKVGWSIIIHFSSPYNASQPLEGRNATARRHVSCYAKWDSTGEKLFTMATSGHCLEHANVCHYTMPVISLCFCLCIGSYIC